jgi:hypothetical protein
VERLEGCIFTTDRNTGIVISFIEHTDIEKDKWDACIADAAFETIYPYSWYLDLASPGWGGLVKGDYEAVMPLTIARKFGCQMLLQPILTQQLGIFSAEPAGEELIGGFIRALPSRFRYIDIHLNTLNMKIPEGIRYRERANYELSLGDTATGYNTNTLRNLQKGRAYPFEFREIRLGQYLDLKYSLEEKMKSRREYVKGLFGGLEKRGRAGIFGLYFGEELQAAAVLGYAVSRVIYLNGCSSEPGKETRAMFVLMDQLIEKSRGEYPVFDFEGSDLPGVARFFDGFGAYRTFYPRIIIRKLPFIGWR